MREFQDAVRARDAAAIEALLADDVVFTSPVTFKPYAGKALTAAILRVECVRACAAAGRALNRDAVREAVRATDRLLVHLADRDRLLPWLGKAEDDAPADRHRTR